MKLSSRLAYLFVGIAIGLVTVIPVNAGAPSLQSKIRDLKKWSLKTFYTKKESNSKFAAKKSMDSLGIDYYKKVESDNRYYTKDQVYSKTENDNLLAGFLKTADASSTYAAKTDLNSYYSKTSIDAILADYLTNSNASATYLTQANATSTYLTQSNASSTYLSQSSAASTYLTQSNATSNYYTKTQSDNNYLAKSGGNLTGDLTAPNYSYPTAKSKVLTISGAAFRNDGGGTITSFAGDVYFGTAGGGQIIAPVNLPDGSLVKQIALYYYDSWSSSDITLRFGQEDFQLPFSPSSFLAELNSSNVGDGSASQALNVTIDNNNKTYYLNGILPVGTINLRIKAVKITYNISNL